MKKLNLKNKEKVAIWLLIKADLYDSWKLVSKSKSVEPILSFIDKHFIYSKEQKDYVIKRFNSIKNK